MTISFAYLHICRLSQLFNTNINSTLKLQSMANLYYVYIQEGKCVPNAIILYHSFNYFIPFFPMINRKDRGWMFQAIYRIYRVSFARNEQLFCDIYRALNYDLPSPMGVALCRSRFCAFTTEKYDWFDRLKILKNMIGRRYNFNRIPIIVKRI